MGESFQGLGVGRLDILWVSEVEDETEHEQGRAA